MSAEEIRRIITLLESAEDWQAKDAAMKAAGKVAKHIMNLQIKKVGLIENNWVQKQVEFKKGAISLNLYAEGGTFFDHYIPLKKRPDPSGSAPPYVAFMVHVTTSGESFRNTSDGPVDESKNYFSWSFEWKDHAPTEQEMNQKIPDIQAALSNAMKIFEEQESRLSS